MPMNSLMRARRIIVAPVFLLMIVFVALLPGTAGASTRHHHRTRAHIADAGCAYANTPATDAPRAALKTAVVCLINQQRRERGLPALADNERLDRSAQAWTDTMVHTNGFSHGDDFSARITAVGFRWSAAGENIATGFVTPRQVVDGWMGSVGHCRNILAPNFADVGTGIVARGVNQYTGRNSSTWTQDFALPMGAHAPSGNNGPANGCPYTV